jgi:hypothetical protein
MGRIYNVLFNSSKGTGSIDSREYYFDWSKLPMGKYKGTFNFVSAKHTTTVSCANIFVDLGQELNYPAMSPTGGQLTTGCFYIGNVGATLVGANGYIYCDHSTNCPFYLLNRPSNNQVVVKILFNDANQTAYTPEAAYSLNLCLEYLDE